MKAITPNPAAERGDLVYLAIPNGAPVRVATVDYARFGLGAYRWYRGPRGRIVASLESDRRTVYLSRLLLSACPGTRVGLRVAEPFDIGDGGGSAFDYRQENMRVLTQSCTRVLA